MRPEKKAIIEEMRGHMSDADYLFLTDFTGMTVEQFEGLRGQLRGQQARMSVVKNSFIKVVAGENGWSDLENWR